MLIAHLPRLLLALMLVTIALAVSACVADRPSDPDFARHSVTPYVGYH
jgi:hypothetical protein